MLSLRCVIYLHKTIAKIDFPEVVGTGKMTIKGCGVELGEDEHFLDTTVNAVAHGHVNQPVCPSNGHLQCTHRNKIFNLLAPKSRKKQKELHITI